ncbi:MAG: RsmE family RNA methyltransferase [Pseudomonadales bacterium]
MQTGEQTLGADRAHYLKNVLRVRNDSELMVFDGTGRVANASVKRQGRDFSLHITSVSQIAPPQGPQVHLAFGLLKSKAMEQVLRKSTELGVTHLWPIYTDHTDLPKRGLKRGVEDHWRAVLISAAEQCGQNYLPLLGAVQPFSELLASSPVAQRLCTDASGTGWPENLPAADTLLFVGPEGGWSSQELLSMQAAAVPVVNLGPLILRAETAPLVALTTLAVGWRLSDSP